jgi:hypothetical protein
MDTLCDVAERGGGTNVAVLVQHAILEESGSEWCQPISVNPPRPQILCARDSERKCALLSNFCFCFLRNSPTSENR